MQEPLPMALEPPEARPARRRPVHAVRGDWRIDARTRRTGLEGLARARAALEATKASAVRAGQPDAA